MQDNSKATLVSILPWRVAEEKVGIIPARFYLEPCSSEEHPEVLVIGDAVHYVYLDENRGNMPFHTPALKLAKAIVSDYDNSMMEVYEDARPGFTFIPGSWVSGEVKSNFSDVLYTLIIQQINWFKRLVSVADDDWNKYHKHSVISDLQRIAARKLGYEREWTVIASIQVPKKCPSCQQNIHPESVVCSFCRCIVDPVKYKTLQFAQQV